MSYKRYLSSLTFLLAIASAVAAPDFNREVRPILAGHCFECHGPDEEERKGDLRLDEPGASDLEVIGRASASALLDRVFTEDGEDLMPPPAKKNPLTEAQKTVLKEWVASGAHYAPHWAFEPPVAAPVPMSEGSAMTPVDAFVEARLAEADLEPAPPASRVTLMRRLSLDLLGFAPTPEEVDAFLGDASPSATQRMIDRLLASPAYGERWARRWLDLARYADTNGYEKDRPRSIWPYRDWVIDAINADLPFDDFSIDQLAGDLRPQASTAQRIATGFHRNTMLNEEGGIDPQEYRFHSLVDRVGTTATVWMGLTMSCAQCHTHKYDPLYHRDYYAMMAYLNNAEEPEMIVPEGNGVQKVREWEDQLAEMEAALPSRFPKNVDREAAFRQWFQERREGAVDWQTIRPVALETGLSRLEVLEDGSVLARGDQTKRDVYTLTFEGDWEDVRAFRLEALPHASLPKGGPGRAYYEGPKGDFFLSEIRLERPDGSSVAWGGGTESYGKLGIGGGDAGAAQAIDGNEVTGWSASGREGEAHQAVFRVADPLKGSGKWTLRLIFNRHYPATLGRFRVALSEDPQATARAYPARDDALFLKEFASLSGEEHARLQKHFFRETPHLQDAREAIAKVKEQRPALPTTLVFEERPANHPRTTYRHHRGEFLQPREAVPAGLPVLFAKHTDRSPKDRYAFAQWLVSEDNPLAARVQVNRDWSAFFGKGLVRTTEDFGYQGEAPSHPQLLDWLAVDFATHGWSRKRLHRLLVTSGTYQRDSKVTPEQWERDPENRLLGRGARFRIAAEHLRDTSLRAAGLLSSKQRGPSVFPPQPANITTEGTYGRLTWQVSEGEDRFRRGLYTFAKRTAPYAMFTTFDAGSGEACLSRREVTNTPLQALTALNDEALMEAAQALGREFAVRSGPLSENVRYLFRRILTRVPDATEQRWLEAFLTKQQKLFAARPEQARAWMKEEEMSEVVAAAAWASLARVLFNLDETFLHQ